VVFAHGYPSSLCDWSDLASRLVRRGYAVLLFDFRKAGGAGRSIGRGELLPHPAARTTRSATVDRFTAGAYARVGRE
jgi:pimeloyl-ACP methyl ester carboxylesterase